MTDSTDNAPDNIVKRLRHGVGEAVGPWPEAIHEAANRIELLETRTKEAVKTLRRGFFASDPTKAAAAIILAIAQLEGHGE